MKLVKKPKQCLVNIMFVWALLCKGFATIHSHLYLSNSKILAALVQEVYVKYRSMKLVNNPQDGYNMMHHYAK